MEKFQEQPQDPRIKKGIQIAEQMWWTLAKRIVKIAGEHYNWTEEEWREAAELFLRPNDYFVVVG